MKKAMCLLAMFAVGVNSQADPSIAVDYNREFSKLATGEVTSLMRELLQDRKDKDFPYWNSLHAQLKSYPVATQATILNAMFDVAPDPVRRRLIWSFVLDEKLPKEVFSGKEIQEWLVEKINGGLPAGPAYFVLTDESAKAVEETARASMGRFGKEKGSLFSLLSAAFLASRGDGEAVELLETLLDADFREGTFRIRETRAGIEQDPMIQ